MADLDHAAIRARAEAATEGPWAAWLDQDGQPHMQGRLMVGNADAVIPDGESWIEDVDVNPVAECLTPEDREFIAHARTDVPALLAEIERLTRERNEALADCGHQRAMRQFASDERDRFVQETIELRAERDALAAKIERVEAIHVRHEFEDSPGVYYCGHCQSTAGLWPCPTVAALDDPSDRTTPV